MGVSQFAASCIVSALMLFHHYSTPVPMQFEKFFIPDALRILDGIVETLTY